MELIEKIGAFAGLAAFFGLALLALLAFAQGRDIRRLREWAGSAPERDTERKESTSAAAAERAEELKRLEEARNAEREAADLREERRSRREAGLPELTRSERLRELFAGSGSRLGEPRYLIAAFVLFLVLAGGVAYAVLEGFGGEDGGTAKAALKPEDIEVAVLNGTEVSGLAGDYSGTLTSRGFKKGKVGNTPGLYGRSLVMFRAGFKPEARIVGRQLQIDRFRPMTAGVASASEGAPVSVILGEDDASSAG